MLSLEGLNSPAAFGLAGSGSQPVFSLAQISWTPDCPKRANCGTNHRDGGGGGAIVLTTVCPSLLPGVLQRE